MIHFFTGDNSFEIQRAVQGLVDSWVKDNSSSSALLEIKPERIDGSELSPQYLPDLLTSATLFSDRRMVVIKNLSENSASWRALSDLLPRLSDDITLVLVDPKPDKRTAIFKNLKSVSQYRDMPNWTDRDIPTAVDWLIGEANQVDLILDKKLAQLIVERVGLDQWELSNAIDKLAAVSGEGGIDEGQITDIVDARPNQNVFGLLEMAMSGQRSRLHEAISSLELSEDPYRLFALLSSQIFQLAAVSYAKDLDQPSGDFGIHPFVAKKLASQSSQLSVGSVARMVKIFAKADADLKSSRGDTWMIIEKALMEATI